MLFGPCSRISRRDRQTAALVHNAKSTRALTHMEAQTKDAITGIGLVAFGAIAVIALCIGICALADAVSRVVA